MKQKKKQKIKMSRENALELSNLRNEIFEMVKEYNLVIDLLSSNHEDELVAFEVEGNTLKKIEPEYARDNWVYIEDNDYEEEDEDE